MKKCRGGTFQRQHAGRGGKGGFRARRCPVGARIVLFWGFLHVLHGQHAESPEAQGTGPNPGVSPQGGPRLGAHPPRVEAQARPGSPRARRRRSASLPAQAGGRLAPRGADPPRASQGPRPQRRRPPAPRPARLLRADGDLQEVLPRVDQETVRREGQHPAPRSGPRDGLRQEEELPRLADQCPGRPHSPGPLQDHENPRGGAHRGALRAGGSLARASPTPPRSPQAPHGGGKHHPGTFVHLRIALDYASTYDAGLSRAIFDAHYAGPSPWPKYGPRKEAKVVFEEVDRPKV